MKNKLYVVLLGIISILTSCDDANENNITNESKEKQEVQNKVTFETFYKTLVFDNFKIDVLKSMSNSDLGVPDAVFQMSEKDIELHAILIEESISSLDSLGKKISLEGYMNLVLNNAVTMIDEAKIEPVYETVQESPNLEFVTAIIKGKSDNNIDTYWRVTIFKTDKSFYNLMTWCLDENSEKIAPIMEKMELSFKEIN